MNIKSALFAMAGIFVLTSCATTPLPILPASHPASPKAPEGPAVSKSQLGPDEATARTDRLLKEQESGSTSAPMDSMPGMNHP